MKILIVDKEGMRDFGRVGHRCKVALDSLGHDTSNFCYRKYYFHKFALGRWIISNRLVNLVKKTKPDIMLVLKGESLTPGTIEIISKMGVKTANWCNDEPFGEIGPFNKITNVSEYDFFFVFDTIYLPRLRKMNKNSYQLPPGADPFEIYKEEIPLEKRSYPYDVSIAGSRYEVRERLLSQLTNFKLAIAGPNWKKTIKELRPFVVHNKYLSIRELVLFFNQSKINLNNYYYHLKNPNIIEPHNSIPQSRTFEIPASRSFQICENLRDIDKYFIPDKEIVLYSSTEELKKKIQYYLDNPEERKKILEAGYARVVKEHTYVHRMKKMLEIINA